MRRFYRTILLLLSIPAIPVSATVLGDSVIGNTDEVFSLSTGTYGDLFPDRDMFEPEMPVMVLDVLRPGEVNERTIVPSTADWSIEDAVGLVYSRVGKSLNLLWASRFDEEVGLYLAQFEDNEWSDVRQLYFSTNGLEPLLTVTSDSLYVELENETPIQVERHTLHLTWLEDEDGDGIFAVAYRPVLLVNGTFRSDAETFILPHLDVNPNETMSSALSDTLRVLPNEDLGTLTIIFGSSTSGRLTSYELAEVDMDFLFLGEMIRRIVLEADFDPQDLAQFAGTLGTHIDGFGRTARRKAYSRLNSTLLSTVSKSLSERIFEIGADYEPEQIDDLANDLRDHTLRLTSSLHSYSQPVTSFSRKNNESSIPEFDISDLINQGANPAVIHVLDLRYVVEYTIPETAGAELLLFTSENGRDFLATWSDQEGKEVWFVESNATASWTEPRVLHISNELSAERAHQLLKQRVR